MKKLYLEILFITCFIYSSSSRVKRYSNHEQRGDWSWGRNDQLTDAQTKSSSQANWPSGGGSTKGRGDSNPNRDGSWSQDSWSSGDNRNSDGYDMGWNNMDQQQPQGNNKGSPYPDTQEEQGAPGEQGDLATLLRGVPGMDFPNLVAIPETDFDCSIMPSQGYYGDVDAGCQVFHICQPGNRKDSFLCPVGTIFNQKYFVCDWWFNVNCSDTPSFYELNNEVYKDPVATVTEEIPVTTEKTLPWNSQDLDRKRPTKSWGNQPSTGKQNTRWKDTPTRRGSKSFDSVSTSREVSNTWSRSDVQKEVSVSWGAGASGASTANFGSSSTSSSSFIPTTKPIWYGIDGQPAKDQSNGMTKRTGLAQTPAPFGTRIKSRSTPLDTLNAWGSTEVYQPTTSPMRSNSYGTSTSTNIWMKQSDDGYSPPSTTKSWFKQDVVADAPKRTKENSWSTNGGYTSSTRGWLNEDIPETAINPTGIKGVWEQQTTRRSDQDAYTSINTVGHKGFVSKSNNSGHNGRLQSDSNDRKAWGQRQSFQKTRSSTATNRGWIKSNSEKSKVSESSNLNTIPRRKSWK